MSSGTDLRKGTVLLGLNITVLLVFFLSSVFNCLGIMPGSGVFRSTTSAVSDKYKLDITPAGWTFAIWGLIYLWQVVWIIYSLTLVCRTGPNGPLYLHPILLSSTFFIVYILNLLLNISWLLLFDREVLGLAFAFLFFIAFTLYVCMWYSYRALEANKFVLAESGRKIDDILIRAFVHNGLGIYAAWATIATFVNMGIVVAFRSNPPISQSTASTITLVFILLTLIAFVATDLTIFDKYSRYTFTPYVVVLWAIGGSIASNDNLKNANTVFSLFILILGVIALVLKIVFVVIRSNTKPVFPYDTVNTAKRASK